MNKENAKDYLPLVQALADGKVIQIKIAHSTWDDIPDPTFQQIPDAYRIKPEPREIWVNEYPFGEEHLHGNPVDAANALRDNGITRHYREVIE